MSFGIPPKSYTQGAAFRKALKELQDALDPAHHRGFHSEQEVVDYLNNEVQFRRAWPITVDTIKQWKRNRRFPFWRPTHSRSFFTTNLHVFVFLAGFKDYRPKDAWNPPTSPEDCEL